MGLGENIYKHRTAKGWSQAGLADALEVSRQSVSKWENDTATPELDKLIKMSDLFEISLDGLVFGEKKAEDPAEKAQPVHKYSSRVVCGLIMLTFGMVFFLLSVFWGDNLYFGEVFGELLSSSIVLISIALLAPYNFTILKVCMIIYFLYTVICFGVLDLPNISNHLFVFITSIVLLVWFIVCGEHASKDKDKREE